MKTEKSKTMIKSRYLWLTFGILILLNSSIPAKTKKVETLQIAEEVLRKGLQSVDLGLYPGILLMHGMSELSLVQGDTKMRDEVIGLFKKYNSGEIKGRGSFICYEAGGSGAPFLLFHGVGKELGDPVADCASRMMEHQKRSSEGIMIPPNKTDNQVFIDMAFAVTPYLLYTGLVLKNQTYIDYAVFETVELMRILKDSETGLLHQGRGFQGMNVISQDNWSRGNGWGAFGLASLVRDLPDDHPQREEVVNLAMDFFSAVLEYQDRDGMWHQEMTDHSSYVETSGSGLLLYGLGIMLEKGLLNSRYRKNFVLGLRGYLQYIGMDGSVTHTCKGCLCPKNGTKDDYRNQLWILNDPHSFGPAVLAFTQAAKLGIKEIKLLKSGLYQLSDNDYSNQERSRTYVRYFPERKDDIAWENDRIAFRIFGTPAKDKVGSGIDVWVKSIDYPIIDKWYRMNDKGLNYHIDRGEGCDFYDMGFSRGCGGLAVWSDGKAYAPGPHCMQRILKNSNKEVIFELHYAPWEVNGIKISEKKIVQMKKGSNLFHVTSQLITEGDVDLTVGIGLTTFGNPQVKTDEGAGILSCWEQVSKESGSLGSAVIVDSKRMAGFDKDGNDQFVLLKVRSNQPFSYYAGASWDGNPLFSSETDWWCYLKKESKKLF